MSIADSGIYNICSNIAAKAKLTDTSAYDGHAEKANVVKLEPKNADSFVTISCKGGKVSVTYGSNYSDEAFAAKGLKVYEPFDYNEKYNSTDALVYNYAVSVRPDIWGSLRGVDLSKVAEKLGGQAAAQGFNFVPQNLSFLAEKSSVSGLSKDMTIDDFLAHVQKNGLDKEINWSAVADSFDAGDASHENFSAYAEYAGAAYASIENRIKTDFSGEEQTARLNKLNEIFSAKTAEYADRFFEKSSSWLSAYEGDNYVKGVSEQKLKDSITAVFSEKVGKYKGIIAANPDYSGVKGTADEWLLRDTRFAANKLLELGKSAPSKNSGGLISEKDLVDMGKIEEAFSLGTTYRHELHGGFVDEEMQGLVIGEHVLKALYTADKAGASAKVRNALENLSNGFIDRAFDKINQENEHTIKQAKQIPSDNITAKQLSSLDKNAVLNVVNKLLESYKKTGDAVSALQEAAAYAYNTQKQKANSPDYENLLRYGSESRKGVIVKKAAGSPHWQNFYNTDNSTDFYKAPLLSMLNILNDWNSFANKK